MQKWSTERLRKTLEGLEKDWKDIQTQIVEEEEASWNEVIRLRFLLIFVVQQHVIGSRQRAIQSARGETVALETV